MNLMISLKTRPIISAHLLISAFILFLFIALAPPSAAQTCNFTNTGLNFGTVDLTGGAQVRMNGSFISNCTGIPKRKVRICVNFNAGSGGIDPSGHPRYMSSGVNKLDYNIYKNGRYSTIWGSRVWAYPPTSATINVTIGASGTGSKTKPVRGQIDAGQPGTPSGLYTSNFSGAQTLISYAYKNFGNCNVIIASGTSLQVPFLVQANVQGACTLTTTDMNFGTTGTIVSNLDATNSISVTCTNGTPYTISLDGGLSGATDPESRKMANGTNNVNYGIYQNSARTTAWGDTIGTNTISSVGNGTAQNFIAYGRVPAQSTPPPGTYLDTIVTTITY